MAQGFKKSSRESMDFYLPGMIYIDGKTGKYPAISITGKKCLLKCLHCKGILLRNMIHVETPEELILRLKNLEKEKLIGALITGGCDMEGKLPWNRFLPVIQKIKTSLFLSAHAGLNVDKKIAKEMKNSPLSQVLIDVTYDEEVLAKIYKLKKPEVVKKTIDNLFTYGPKVIPHIIIGINKGRIKEEYRTLELLSQYHPELLVLVVIMPLNPSFRHPPVDEVVDVFREARKRFKKISLGCARPRGKYRYILEEKLIEEALIDRMAIWSDRAIKKAREKGYKINYHYTCCSV